jgi:hypothetical protein
MKTPHPANWSTVDLQLELIARCVEDERDHDRVIDGFLKLVRLTATQSSPRQRRQTAESLRNLADELEVLTVVKT